MYGPKISIDVSTPSIVHIDSSEDSDISEAVEVSIHIRRIKKLCMLFPPYAEEKFKTFFQANSSVKFTRILILITLLWDILLPFALQFTEPVAPSIHTVGYVVAGCAGIIHLLFLCISFIKREFVVSNREYLLLASQVVSMLEGAFTVALHAPGNILFYVPFPFLFNFTRFFIAVSYH